MAIPTPKPQAAMVGPNFWPTTEWYNYLKQAYEDAAGNAALQAEIDAIILRLQALEAAGAFVIQGPMSVRVTGTPADGLVQVTLQGDAANPGISLYYGTNASGVKGFYELPDPVADVPFNYITSDGEPYCTEDYADLYAGVL